MNERYAKCIPFDKNVKGRIGGNPPKCIEGQIPCDYKFYATLVHPEKENIMLSIIIHQDYDTLIDNNIYPSIAVKVIEHEFSEIGNCAEKRNASLDMCSISEYSEDKDSENILVKIGGEPSLIQDEESYYKEFVRMNPNNRDALILRYRIDKAAGVPISQLIDTLKSLKEEEYIEEWAYELAKLYQQAGRYEECAEECEDIKLWFGQGEIVERAKLLLEHIEEKNPLPFMDDKDFTVKTEKPNPDDTGSLPALNEYLEAGNEQEMKYLKKVDPAKFEETMVKTISEEEHSGMKNWK